MANAPNTDHDGLFKDLFREFFADFLKAFFPDIYSYLNLEQLDFLQQELIIQPTKYPKRRADLVVKAKTQDSGEFILIHIENQMTKEEDFAERMFRYFQRLNFKEGLPIIPIAVLAYEHHPQEEEPAHYSIFFPFGEVMRYNFFKVELMKLYWRDFLDSNNPVALALMGKMKHVQQERVEMKLKFLIRIVKLNLDSEQLETIVSFFENYIKLTDEEELELEEELAKLNSEEVITVQRLTTSWEERGRKEGIEQGMAQGMAQGMERGMEQGMVRGEAQGQIKVLLYLLQERFGRVPPSVESKFYSLPSEKLLGLSKKLIEVSSLEEFSKFLH